MKKLAALLLGWLLPMAAGGEVEHDCHLSEYTAILQDWRPVSEVDLSPPEAQEMVIYEVTRFPERTEPSREQLEAAGEFWDRARKAVKARGWDDFDQAIADGFELMFGDDNHYASRKHVLDGRVLDPERPEFLIYYDTGSENRLAGLMFLAAPDGHGPQIAGPMSVWHFHTWKHQLCLWQGLLVDGVPENGECSEGVASHRSPEMIHLWFFDHPQGMFATGMDLEPFQIKRLDELDY